MTCIITNQLFQGMLDLWVLRSGNITELVLHMTGIQLEQVSAIETLAI